jgi:hypothetical protein
MSTELELGKYIPLKMVIAMFLDQYDKSNADEDRLWILGMRALVELNFDISAQPQTVRLPVEQNFTVKFPSGCLNWVKIGILDAQNQVSTLKINNALTTFRDDNPNRISKLNSPDINDSIGSLAGAPIFFNFYNNGYYNNFYGIGGGLVQFGECRVDDRNQVVILDHHFKYTSILFEYISAPQKDPDFKVELALSEAVIAFIAWKLKMGTAQEFYGEVTKARRRLPGKKVTLQEINQVIREASGGYLHA